MKRTTVTPNITQVKRANFVSAYLVREDDGFTLIDTCLGGSAKGLIAAARNAGGEIRRIALTHGHGDHIGSLDALKNTLGADVEVMIGDLDARILAGEKVVEGKMRGAWPKNVQTKPDVRLTGGERIGSLEVISSPGHTPGHVSYRDTRDALIYHPRLLPTPVLTVAMAATETDTDSFLANITVSGGAIRPRKAYASIVEIPKIRG